MLHKHLFVSWHTLWPYLPTISLGQYSIIYLNKPVLFVCFFFTFELFLYYNSVVMDIFGDYSKPPLSTGDMFQDPQWMPEIADSTSPVYTVFSILI